MFAWNFIYEYLIVPCCSFLCINGHLGRTRVFYGLTSCSNYKIFLHYHESISQYCSGHIAISLDRSIMSTDAQKYLLDTKWYLRYVVVFNFCNMRGLQWVELLRYKLSHVINIVNYNFCIVWRSLQYNSFTISKLKYICNYVN